MIGNVLVAHSSLDAMRDDLPSRAVMCHVSAAHASALFVTLLCVHDRRLASSLRGSCRYCTMTYDMSTETRVDDALLSLEWVLVGRGCGPAGRGGEVSSTSTTML
jgi:hypothetical protein